MNHRWTQDEKQQMVRLWDAGRTVSEIAVTLGKSESAVKNQRGALGLPPRKTGDPKRKFRVSVRPEVYELLQLRARRLGRSVPGHVRHLIDTDLAEPDDRESAK